MGILGRLTEMRRHQVLTRRFGKEWGQKLFDLLMLSDTPFTVGPDGNLTHAPTGFSAELGVEGLDAAIAGSRNWMAWAAERGMRFRVDQGTLYTEVDGIRLFLPNRNDYFTLAEVFREELYRFEINGDFAFMDIGANIGMTSLYLASRHPGTVYGYELVPSTADAARLNLSLNPKLATRIELAATGLAKAEGEAKIRIDPENTACNSLFADLGGAEVEVKLLDAAKELERVLAANPGRRLFVKLDAEGAEYEILDRWHEAGCLEKIDVLVLEWHVVEGRTVEEIRDRMRQGGFQWFERVHWSEPVGFITAWRPRA